MLVGYGIVLLLLGIAMIGLEHQIDELNSRMFGWMVQEILGELRPPETE